MKVSNTSERLRELMELYHLKQIDVARMTGLHKATISYYIKGQREPAQDNIFTIASAFNVDPAWLMGYDVPMQKNVDAEDKYNLESAELVLMVNNDERLKNIIKSFVKLNDTQKTTIEQLIMSMVNH